MRAVRIESGQPLQSLGMIQTDAEVQRADGSWIDRQHMPIDNVFTREPARRWRIARRRTVMLADQRVLRVVQVRKDFV